MATLGEIRDAVFPSATASSAADARLGATVGWVRVLRARVPALDAPEPGDLIVVPVSALAIVAPSASLIVELVVALARSRVAGLLVVGPDVHGAAESGDRGPAAEIVEAAGSAGLPAFRLGEGDVAALERGIIGCIIDRRAELEHQAGVLEARLERLALGGGEPAELLAEVGTFLGRPVALEGRRGDVLAAHVPAGDPAAAAAVARYQGGARTGALRVNLPGGGGASAEPAVERSAGTLVLLGARPASELERIATERIAGLVALQLARDEAVRRARDAGRRDGALPSAGPPWVVLVARQGSAEAAGGIEAREATRREIRALAPARVLALRGDAESLELRAVLAAGAEDPGGLAMAARIAALLGRSVAVSRPFHAPGDRPLAEAEARSTLEAVEGLADADPSIGGVLVARADRQAAYRLLGGLHNVPDGTRHARALLEPLLVGRPEVVAERLATLRAVLEAPGMAEAADALGIHRNTLAYRLRRIEALTGWRPTDPELRLPLAMAVRLVQSAQ